MFKGSATAMITPFTKDGKEVNYDAFKEQIDYQIENGTSALIILGTTGEPATLTHKECVEIVNFAVTYINKRVPVIVGSGSNSTALAIEKSKEFEALGADGLLIVTPYYNKCTQNGLIAHYTAISKNTSLPIILYNVPGRTGVNMLPNTVKELSKLKNVIAVKEASGNIEQMMEIKRLCLDFTIYSGEDALTYLALCLGASGVISVASNVVPNKMSRLCKTFFEGNLEASLKEQLTLNPLIKLLFCETNPIPVKKAMNLLGRAAGPLRLPLTEMEEGNTQKLKQELQHLNLL